MKTASLQKHGWASGEEEPLCSRSGGRKNERERCLAVSEHELSKKDSVRKGNLAQNVRA